MNIFLLIITISIATLVLIFNNILTKNRKFFLYFRICFLTWILVWLGWVIGGQLSVIHLINFFEIIVSSNNNFSAFLAEPIILLVGIFTVIVSTNSLKCYATLGVCQG